MKKQRKIMCFPLMTGDRSDLMPSIAGRPDMMGKRTSLTVYEGMTGIDGKCIYQYKEPHLHHYCRR